MNSQQHGGGEVGSVKKTGERWTRRYSGVRKMTVHVVKKRGGRKFSIARKQ